MKVFDGGFVDYKAIVADEVNLDKPQKAEPPQNIIK